MNYHDSAMLLAKLAAYDRRTVGEADIVGWSEVMGDVELTDALEAVTMHYASSADFAMPSHILRQVSVIRNRRADVRQTERLRMLWYEGSPLVPSSVQRWAEMCREALRLARGFNLKSDRSPIRIECEYCGAKPGRVCWNAAAGKPLRGEFHHSRKAAESRTDVSGLS